MENIINVEGIKLYAYHGCLDAESKIGGHYVVDIYMKTDFMDAAKEDDLSKTIDYCEVYEIVKAEMAVRSKLIEQVALRIMNKLKAQVMGLKACRVKLTKLSPPMNGNVERVSVEIIEGNFA